MFCSNDCRNEYEQRTARYSELSTDAIFDNLKKALDIVGGYKELSRIYCDPPKRTVFDYDFSKPNDKTTKLNMLKCVASLEKCELDPSEALKTTKLRIVELLKSVKMSSRNKKIIVDFCYQNFLITCYYTFEFLNFTTAIPIFLPLINHSCDPNIDILNVEGRFVALVNRPLKAGDQIFLATE